MITAGFRAFPEWLSCFFSFSRDNAQQEDEWRLAFQKTACLTCYPSQVCKNEWCLKCVSGPLWGAHTHMSMHKVVHKHTSFLWTAGLWLDRCGFTWLMRMTGINAVVVFSWLCLISRRDCGLFLQHCFVVCVGTYINILNYYFPWEKKMLVVTMEPAKSFSAQYKQTIMNQWGIYEKANFYMELCFHYE